MNDKKSKINLGFRKLFHIPSVKRGPVRDEVTRLQIALSKLPSSDEVREARTKLEQAANLAFGQMPVNDDTARQKAVDDAKRLCADVALALQGMGSGVKQSDGKGQLDTQRHGKEELKAAEQSAKQLKADAQALRLRIEALKTPSPPDRQPVLMPSEAWSVGTLLGAVAGWELAIDSAVVTAKRKKELEDQWVEIDKAVIEAQGFVRKANEEANTIRLGVLTEAVQAVTSLRKLKEPVPSLEELLLVKLTAQLSAALTPEKLLVLDGVQRLAVQVRRELDLLSKDQAAYIRHAQAQALQQEQQRAFDALVSGPVESLRQIAGPLRLPELPQVFLAVAEAHTSLGQPPGSKGAPQTGKALAAKVLDEVKKVRKIAEAQAKALRKEVDEARQALSDALKRVAATKGEPVCAADWRLIESAKASVESMLPKNDKDPSQPLEALIPLVAACKPLIKQVGELVTRIETDLPGLTSFDEDLKATDQALTKAAEEGAPLKVWDEKALADLQAAMAKLKKGVGTVPAAASLKALSKLKQDFADKLKSAKEVADYWAPHEGALRQVYLCISLAGSDLGGDPIPQPNRVEQALAEVQQAREARPVNLSALKSAIDKLFKLVGSGSDHEVRKAANATHQEAQDEQDKQASEKEGRQRELKERLYGVDERVNRAAALVKASKGDTAPVDRLKALLKKAQQHIDADDADQANRTMDQIVQRITLIQANPLGEPARRRGELGKLHQEWVEVRSKADGSLQVVHDKVLEHLNTVSDGKAQGAIRSLGDAVANYRARFTQGLSPLQAPLSLLANEDTPDAGKRKAREEALATVVDLQRHLQAHPLTTELAKAPLPAARAVPASLMRTLDRLKFTVLTSVG